MTTWCSTSSLAARIAACEAAGIERRRIMVDPGIGFGKTVERCWATWRCCTGSAWVVGASRKSFIGKLTGETVAARRIAGSLGAAVAIVMQGVQVVRGHDVAETRQAVAVWRAGGVKDWFLLAQWPHSLHSVG